jgi:hypothetical protein
MKEVTGGWRKLHEEFHNFCSSPNIIKVFKSRRMKWRGHGGDEKYLQHLDQKSMKRKENLA